jgi:cysteine desulfurase / selenocysteine lyase
MIYLDNAATSFPKPPSLAEAMAKHLATQAVNPGRSGYDLSLKAGRRIDDLRQRLAQFFNHPDQNPDRVVFTSNATDALNLAIQGVCRPGDHIVATVLEHNSVLRPLFELQKKGITHDLAPCDARGFVHPESIEALIRPETRLVIMTHASNVLGTIQPAAEVGAICRTRGIHFLLDTAQTAGVHPVDMAASGADLLAFTGHKGLLGPTGTGGLLVANNVHVSPIRWGGTGVFSAQREHPEKYPYRLEAGTLNTMGLVGLEAGLDWLQNHHPAEIERNLTNRLLAGLGDISSVRVLGLENGENDISLANRTAVTSILVDGMAPDKTGMFLDMEWDIAVRTGLQCAPLAHKAMGTENEGTVRISPGPFNSAEEIDCLLEALASFKT